MTLERRTPLRRTALKRGSSTLRRTRLKQVSDKFANDVDKRRAFSEAVRQRDGDQCQGRPVVVEVACQGRRAAHHVKPKGTGGARYDVDNGVWLCWSHHLWVHDHPKEAKAKGLLA